MGRCRLLARSAIHPLPGNRSATNLNSITTRPAIRCEACMRVLHARSATSVRCSPTWAAIARIVTLTCIAGKMERSATLCHRVSGWQVSLQYINAHQDRFPLIGAHAVADCYSCHRGRRRRSIQSTGTFDRMRELPPEGVSKDDCAESSGVGIFHELPSMPHEHGQLDDRGHDLVRGQEGKSEREARSNGPNQCRQVRHRP